MNQLVDQPTRITVEACVGSLAGALLAASAGADRIELNLALELDGLTPSAGLLELVSQAVAIPIIAMTRPRAGDFVYSPSEWSTLTTDANWLLSHGADGIAFGCLDANRQIDCQRCLQVRKLAGKQEIVFHKAFDDVADWNVGLEQLIDCGVDRVMTSGLASTAETGIATLARIIELAAGRIEVLPAGGITSKNAVKIVAETGCRQVHGSFSPNPETDVGREIRRTIDFLDIGPNKH